MSNPLQSEYIEDTLCLYTLYISMFSSLFSSLLFLCHFVFCFFLVNTLYIFLHAITRGLLYISTVLHINYSLHKYIYIYIYIYSCDIDFII